MDNFMEKGWNRIKIVHKNIGFFHGYYIWKGCRPIIKIPNWLGKILVNRA